MPPVASALRLALLSSTLLVSSMLGARPLAAQQLSAEQASRVTEGCAVHARTKRQSHAVAVVDAGGHLVAFLRMDGNAHGIGAFALEKAEAVAAWRFPTADMTIAARETPGFAHAPRVVTVPGGVPIYSADGTQFLGAVGVSGEAPTDDVACAEAGIRAAGLQPARRRAGGP